MTTGTTSIRFAAAPGGTELTKTPFGRPLSLLLVVMLLGVISAQGDTPESEFLPGPKTPPDYRPDRGDLDGRGLDLAEAVFVGLVPHGERFDNANLRRAKFYQGYFAERTSFRGADLRDAVIDIEVQKLDLCDFQDARINGLETCRLTGEQIAVTESYRKRDLSRCCLTGEAGAQALQLAGFDLTETNFFDLDLTKMDLSKADLTRARFIRCTLRQEQVVKSAGFFRQIERSSERREDTFWDLAWHAPRRGGGFFQQYGGMKFADMDLRGWSFANANLRRTGFYDCNLADADFTGAEVGNAYLYGVTFEQLATTANFRRHELLGVTLAGVDLRGRDFSRMNLTGVRFECCNVQGLDLTDAIVTGAYLNIGVKPEQQFTLDQIRSTWNARHGRLEGVALPPSAIHLSGSSTSAPKE